MLKANVGLSRKVSENYNSDGFSVNLEGEIFATRDDPEAVIERIKELFDLAEEALSQQVDRHQSDSAIASRDADPQPGNNGHSNGHANGPPSGRNGHQNGKPGGTGEPASNKQVQYLQTLAKRQKLFGTKLDGFIEQTVGRHCSPYDLNKKEAGAVIDALNPEEAGDNRPPTLKTRNNSDFPAPGMGDLPVPVFFGGLMLKPVVPRPHWSYSSVSQYLKCPLQYYFERVVKLPRGTTTAAQVLGSAVHSALADYHRKLQAGEPVTAQNVHRAYLAAWDAQAENGPIVGSGGKPVGDSRDLGLALVDVYLAEPPPQSIIAVERPILAPIANSHGEYLERPILVVADLIVRRDDSSLLINEIKTAGRSFSESEVATSHQPTFYANALCEMTGEESAVEFTVLVKTKQPKVQKIQAVRTISDYQRLGDIVEAVERGVEAGVFYPVESPLNCSGCPFFRPCREWTGHQTRDEMIHSEPQEAARC